MFDLEAAIAEWRREMRAAGIKGAALEELESHVRDDAQRRIRDGVSPKRAFEEAAGQLGPADALKSEFTKMGKTIPRWIRRNLFGVAETANLQLVRDMNTSNTTVESGWATYAKGAAFLMPAAICWLFSIVFLLPKIREISQAAGTNAWDFAGAPAVFRALAVVGEAMLFLTAHGWVVVGSLALGFVLVERRSGAWPRYRRAAVGAGIFLFNFGAFVSITLMVISGIVAATAFTNHVK